jgi:hypothetical protein
MQARRSAFTSIPPMALSRREPGYQLTRMDAKVDDCRYAARQSRRDQRAVQRAS